MSPFDRQVRLKTDRDVSEPEFLAFLPQHVLPWEENDIRKLSPLIAALEAKLRPWKLKLPSVVLLVKTTGREEGGAAYCRGQAIVLPQNMIDGPREHLEKILPHEVFHNLSSQNPELREKLYAIIGFRSCNEVQLPEPLRAKRITNPDAPVTGFLRTDRPQHVVHHSSRRDPGREFCIATEWPHQFADAPRGRSNGQRPAGHRGTVKSTCYSAAARS
ncbi:MAG: hypothetical protein HY288_10375 [Planctomycetia bacterium]|nr:hypothetical protein [Planctomycetia bacterium]